jgi:Fe-S oxidoreductase
MSKRDILLLEPNYKNKYPPMGLMKIATYYRCRGDNVRFYKGDLKLFAAQLLFEDYIANIKTEKSFADSIIYSFIIKRGSSNIIEYIKTGKHAPLEIIAEFSRSSIDVEECSVNNLIDALAYYRNRYKNEDYPKFDRVGVTTLFTFYWKETVETIEFAKKICKKVKDVHVGGIASSLVPEYIEKETGIKPHVGLLSEPFTYDKDKKGNVIIDELPLDYSILEEIDYRYPTENAYFGYMTRGCPNKCTFCAVPELEPNYCSYIGIKSKIQKVEECFGAKRDLLLMDNNVFASECFNKIIDEIKECGFAKGVTYIPANEYEIAYRNLCDGFKLGEGKAKNVYNDRAYFKKLIRIYDEITEKLSGEDKGKFYSERENLGLLYPETAKKETIIAFNNTTKSLYDKLFKQGERVRFIDFNQGLDGRLATDDKMKKISEIAIRPLRIAFDHIKMKNIYERAVRTAVKHGICDLSNYLLYNYTDHPDELYERMSMNVNLCDELGIAIYSFPMKYHPINDPEYFRNRDYIGKPHWNRKFIRAIQAVLNSTHGKIGRGKTFFEAAFGKDIEEYRKILWMPEALIIQRYKYDEEKRREYYGENPTPYDDVNKETGRITLDWWAKFNALNSEQRVIIERIITEHNFTDEAVDVVDKEIKEVLKYYQIKRDK